MNPRPLRLIVVPFHSGRRATGMGRGPLSLVGEHRLGDRLTASGHEVSTAEIADPNPDDGEIARTFEINRRVSAAVGAAIADDVLPVVLSGNCNTALGTTAAIGADRLGVLWLDAHADFDLPDDNVSGFFDVMTLSILTGSCWAALRRTIPGFREIAEEDVLLVGVRDLASYQRERLERSVVHSVPGGEAGIDAAAARHLDRLASSVEAMYVHVDFDCLDDSYGRANAYAAPSGLRLDQLERIAAEAAKRSSIGALSFTAYDPSIDKDGEFAKVALRAIEAVVGTTASAAQPNVNE